MGFNGSFFESIIQLSLEEEVKMQQTWKEDDDKCTFILLSKDKCNLLLDKHGGGKNSLPSTFIQSTLHSMIGDVNLFLSEEDSEDEGDDINYDSVNKKVKRKQAELDIMVAESDQRRKGIGKEAVCMMMLYGAQYLNISRFFVKIKEENQASRNLFEKALNFRECNYVACFKEFEFEWVFDNPKEAVDGIRKMYNHETTMYYIQI
jgi:RimJ/RimL family protein N-acetyltransferase